MYVICLSWEIGGGAVGAIEAVAASSTGYTGYCLANSVAVALWGEGLGYMGLDMSNCLDTGFMPHCFKFCFGYIDCFFSIK